MPVGSEPDGGGFNLKNKSLYLCKPIAEFEKLTVRQGDSNAPVNFTTLSRANKTLSELGFMPLPNSAFV